MSDILKLNSSGPDVADLQQALQAAGFSPGSIDGYFGNGIEAAVLAYQRSAGLAADGVVGPKTTTSLGLKVIPAVPSSIPNVTVAIVSAMFHVTPLVNIKLNLPVVLDSLVTATLSDKMMVLMALGTIRAETESFLPISEGESRFNTSPSGHLFDLYANRKDLGNTGPPDGELFRGRGFIQLTGRDNYTRYSREIGEDLVTNPETANDPLIAAKLLARFIADRENSIREALIQNDLATAQRLVNGGSNGLDRFTDAFQKGMQMIPN